MAQMKHYCLGEHRLTAVFFEPTKLKSIQIALHHRFTNGDLGQATGQCCQPPLFAIT
jgi:hypothetical protein